METIRIYIENVFKVFGNSERVSGLKRDMLAGMEEKYHALKSEGKSENEAVGSVIADFGNIDEIAAELGVNPPVVQTQSAEKENTDNIIPVSREDAFELLAVFKKASIWIGVGVWLVMLGVSAMMLISGFNEITAVPNRIQEVFTNTKNIDITGGFALFALFLAIAPAVILFIVHGMSLNRYYEKYGVKKLFLDSSTRAEFERKREQFMPKFTALIAAGVTVVLLSVGGFVLTASLGFETFSISGLIFAIGFATFLFIIAGMEYHAFDYVLCRGDYANKKQTQDSERIIGTVAAVFWPLMTAVYLLWSFIGNNWHISWLVWPIAGILFGAFSGGISVWTEGKK